MYLYVCMSRVVNLPSVQLDTTQVPSLCLVKSVAVVVAWSQCAEMKHNIVATVIVLLAIYFTRATDPQDDSDDDVVVNNNNETNIEVLPEAVAWTDAPMCPMWGPMESFYQEGIEKGRVSVFTLDWIYSVSLWTTPDHILY